MGGNKAFLELDGQSLVARVLDKLSALCSELIISANDTALFADLPARVVSDIIPNGGPLSGIHAGLASMRHEGALVLACDLPFVSERLLRYMMEVAPGYDVVVPRLCGEYEPLHALYSVSCKEPIEALLADGPQRIVNLYRRVRVREITQAEIDRLDAALSFFNVNSPDDWAEAQRLWARIQRRRLPTASRASSNAVPRGSACRSNGCGH
jgi:molybdopterin-guanine dinucleotide biosynthesis protein A